MIRNTTVISHQKWIQESAIIYLYSSFAISYKVYDIHGLYLLYPWKTAIWASENPHLLVKGLQYNSNQFSSFQIKKYDVSL